MINSNPKISIIGCGRVGTALAVFLARAGYDIAGLASAHAASAEAAAGAAGQGRVYDTAHKAVAAGDVVFITTPDQLIEPVCRILARETGLLAERMVFHCSGALSSKILSSAGKAGAHVGSIHPLQSFAPYAPGQSSPFSGIHISVEGDGEAVAAGKKMVAALGGSFFTLPTHAKTLYHAAAVVASNYLVTLEHFAVSLLSQASLSEKEAFAILEPLISGTLNNIRNQGTGHALTGPVARGDAAVVADHLADLEQKMPDYVALYKILGRHTLDIARQMAAGQDTEGFQSLERLFSSPDRHGRTGIGAPGPAHNEV